MANVVLPQKKWMRLSKARQQSFQDLAGFRAERLDAIEQYAGHRYGNGQSEDGSDATRMDRSPMNMLELAVPTYTRDLASSNPQVTVATRHPDLQRSAELLMMGLNELMTRIRLGETLNRGALNSLFGLGIFKVGMMYGAAQVGPRRGEVDLPTVTVVDDADWVHDMTARHFDEARFMGHRIRVYESDLDAMPGMDKKAREKWLKRMRDGSTDTGERTENVGGTIRGGKDAFEPYTEGWELYLPFEGLLVTIGDELGDGEEPLSVLDWDGPDDGPYHILSYDEIPNNVMPKAPVSGWCDLNLLIQDLTVKVGRQARSQRNLLGYQAGGGEDDARLIQLAGDLDALRLTKADGVKELSVGGVDQRSLAILLQAMQWFSYKAGNLDMLAGLGAQSPTATQDELLARTASKQLMGMQSKVVKATTRIAKSLAWYLWYDPGIELPLAWTVPGTTIRVPVTYTEEERRGDFLDYNLTIVPYSLVEQTPADKLQVLQGALVNLIMPLMPFLERQGLTIDGQALVKRVGEWANVPELEEILTFGAASVGQDAPVGESEGPGKSPVTTRNYVRTNRPGATNGGKAAAMIQTLMGAGVQPAEMAAMGRQTG